MNPRIEKLREERNQALRRRDALNAKIEKLNRKITELENTDIIGVVREKGLTVEQLTEMMDIMKKNPAARMPERFSKTEENDEE